jgi:hypothetical protein
MAPIIFSPHKTLFPPCTYLDLIQVRFIPGLVTLIDISFWKEQTDTPAAGFNSDHRIEEFRSNDLLRRRNRKGHLDLVFDFCDSSSNLYRCDSESGLLQYRRSLIQPIFELNLKRNRMGLSVQFQIPMNNTVIGPVMLHLAEDAGEAKRELWARKAGTPFSG